MALTNEEARITGNALRQMVEFVQGAPDVEYMSNEEKLAAKEKLEQFLLILKNALLKV